MKKYNKKYNFERFTGKGSRLSNYSISFNKSLSFGLSSSFYKKENISKYKRVFLYFDNKKTAVGFHFTSDDNTDGSFAVAHGKTQNTGSISCRSFILENNLNKATYFGKKSPKKINYNNVVLYVIELAEDKSE